AQPERPSRYSALFTNRFWSGLWTQRNPLRDAASSFFQEKYYSGVRNDALIDGESVEITNRLTLARRPGLSVYNSQSFPPIKTYYSFKKNTANTETIQVIADTASVIYDATGPSTKNGFFTKTTGAGQTYFQSVGNYLYFGDGAEVRKWDGSTVT